MKRPVLLDGSCGSFLWQLADDRGIEKNPPWLFNIEHPELVLEMHGRYIEAGSEMIQTNTFSANRDSVSRYPQYSVTQVIEEAVKLARKAADGTGVKTYLSSGPLTRLLEPYGNLSKEECRDQYEEIIGTAVDAGVDAIMLETFMDLEMMKEAARVAVKFGKPVIASMTFEKKHRTMFGNTISQICADLEELGVNAVGMNCSKGPKEGLEIIKEFHETTGLPLYFKPNAGMGENYTAEDFALEVEPSLEYVRYIGGCCGCDDDYIRELKRKSESA